ncbi:MAG TPA: 2-oxoacid:acceptor oxidoreductase subunit alpha [Chthoniobacterales bacterium]|jgi:2-oxoglutarate ferredoxin oxidoreductase subunit alpha|nr:2-oxoacid:acceptor oxidoreductase subunit alpha [Chthoniobacterales bacterium]
MGDPVNPDVTAVQKPEASAAATDRADLTPENINDAVIRLAGNSQDGIQTAGAFLARLAGRSDHDVMTYMTIPSTISGGPSIFQVRMGTGEVLSAGDEADFLVAFYQHSYQDHIDFLKEGGVLLYDSDNVEPNLDDKRFMYVGVPITGLTVEALGGTAKDRGKNIFILGLIAKIFSLDVEKLTTLIKEKFAGKDESIVNTAIMAFTAGYAYPVGNVLKKHYQFEHKPKTGGRAQITMDGNQAIAYGLIAGGVRYGAGYPITPWSSIMEMLRRELPKYGGIFVQAEDELGAVSISLGFSYSGYLAVTGSAGPGISLKSEAIGWASMAEMPLIICNIQRGGPSTGLPTNVEQSDLHQAIYGSHGDSPRVVLAAATVEDCFYIAIEAARIARKYSTPVFILSDTSLATRIEAFDEPDLAKLMVDPKPDLTPRQKHVPYALDQITQHVPPGTRILDGKYPLLSGLEHDEMGHPTGSPKLHMAMTAKRRNKLRKLAEEIPVPEVYGDEKGDTLLVGWGSTYGPIHDAVKMAREHGEKIGALHLRHVHPLPNGLEKIFANFDRIVTVEMNDQGLYGFGQLATILRARYCEPKIESVTKTDGLTFRVKEILQGVFPGKFVSVRGYSPNRPIAGNGEQDVDLARHESITQGVG